MPNNRTPILQIKKLTKIFGKLKANDEVSLDIHAGEIHALLGENGAGKSTFVKMLYGSLQPDSGEIIWNGHSVAIKNPFQARALGIGMVFQHFSLFEPLTAAENIAIALDDDADLNTVSNEAAAVGERYGLPLRPNALVGDLSVGERQRIEIVRCLMQEPKLIILDEPTSVLTPQEADKLFETLEILRKQGRSILYISHKLDEVRRLCDRATVLRHGKYVGSCVPQNETPSSMAAMMVGHDVDDVDNKTKPSDDATSKEPIFEIKNLSHKATTPFSVALKNIDLCVHKGEVYGIAGVAGNGQSELFEILSGETNSQKNTIFLNQRDISRYSINRRRLEGAAFAPEERFGHAAVGSLSLSDNIFLTRHACDAKQLGGRSPFSIINRDALQKLLNAVVTNMDVRKSGSNPDASTLSGGNLQKLIIGREFSRNPTFFVVNQPTWGVDAAAAIRIRQGLIDLAKMGSSVLLISQDLDELFSICDRISVISEGKLSPPLEGDGLNRETVGLLMGGAKDGFKEAV